MSTKAHYRKSGELVYLQKKFKDSHPDGYRLISGFQWTVLISIFFYTGLLKATEENWLASRQTSEKSLSFATAFAFYEAHFMGAPVPVDKRCQTWTSA